MKCVVCNYPISFWQFSCPHCRHSSWKLPQILLVIVLIILTTFGILMLLDVGKFGAVPRQAAPPDTKTTTPAPEMPKHRKNLSIENNP